MDTAKAETPPRSHSAAHAVTALYEAHAIGLVRLAVIMTGDQGSAEDIVQDAFLGLYRRWDRLTDSWTADSRTLAFGVENTSSSGVRLLDTAAGGTDLMADSRLAVEQSFRDQGRSLKDAAPPYYFVSCTTDAMISMDGSAIVCGYSTTIGKTTTMGFAQYSTGTRKMSHVGGLVHFKGQAPIGISLYWVNSTGKTAIGTSETTSGGRVGVLSGDTFTPLPGVTGFAAIAW